MPVPTQAHCPGGWTGARRAPSVRDRPRSPTAPGVKGRRVQGGGLRSCSKGWRPRSGVGAPAFQDPEEDAAPPEGAAGAARRGREREAVVRQEHRSPTWRNGALLGAGSDDGSEQDAEGEAGVRLDPTQGAKGRDQPRCDWKPKGTHTRPPTATSACTRRAGEGART